MSQIVVSYQMGKVGSSSITASVDNCIQIHSWSSINSYIYFSSVFSGSLKGRIYSDIRWYLIFHKLRYLISSQKPNRPVKLIIGVREAVSRNVSGYFQSLTSSRDRLISVEQCIDDFYVNCPHYLPVYWFDIELKRKLGIDVYDYPFDKTKGFGRFLHDDKYEVFVYQLEKLASLTGEIADFLDDDTFQLAQVNRASDKWYSDLNHQFIEKFKPSTSYLDSLYSSKYMKHFYTESDIDAFKDKWT